MNINMSEDTINRLVFLKNTKGMTFTSAIRIAIEKMTEGESIKKIAPKKPVDPRILADIERWKTPGLFCPACHKMTPCECTEEFVIERCKIFFGISD